MPSDVPVRSEPPALADPEATVDRLMRVIQTSVTDAGVERVVVNMSGELDSTVTATLATDALGSERVTGLIMPTETNRTKNIDDARRVAEELVIDHQIVDLQPILDAFVGAVSSETHIQPGRSLAPRKAVTTVAIKPRTRCKNAVGKAAAHLRMAIAYFVANTTDALVLGTRNRTELLLGYFTKYGDGGVDLLPIGDLYKTEVRQLARALDIDEGIIEKPPTAGLQVGQTDEAELGAPYREIDTALWNLFEVEADAETVAKTTALSVDRIAHLVDRHDANAHKRRLPATATEIHGGNVIQRA